MKSFIKESGLFVLCFNKINEIKLSLKKKSKYSVVRSILWQVSGRLRCGSKSENYKKVLQPLNEKVIKQPERFNIHFEKHS